MLWDCCTYAHIRRLFIFQLSVNLTQAVGVALLHAYQVKACCCIPMIGLYMTSRQVTCVWTVALHMRNGQVHESWEPVTLTGQTFGLCIWIWIFAREASCGNSMIIANLAPCTVQLIVHCLNIQCWGCGFSALPDRVAYWCLIIKEGHATTAGKHESFVCGLDHCTTVVNTVLTFGSHKMWGISWLPQGQCLTFSIAEM